MYVREQGKEMQLNEYTACFRLKNIYNETQHVAAGVDSVVHLHKLVCVGNTDVVLHCSIIGMR